MFIIFFHALLTAENTQMRNMSVNEYMFTTAMRPYARVRFEDLDFPPALKLNSTSFSYDF